MKLLDVISYFDKIHPNSFDYNTKRSWLLSLETEIKSFIYLHKKGEYSTDYINEENPELILDANHMELYVYYLVSMADMTNAEYKLYNISSTYFNKLFDRWKKRHRSTNLPEKTRNIKI